MEDQQSSNNIETYFQKVNRIFFGLAWYVIFGWAVYERSYIGAVYYLLAVSAFYLILYVCFGLQRLSAAERFFNFDDPRQASNLVHFQKIDRVQAEKFRNLIIHKSLAHKRLKSKMVSFLGRTFFQPIPDLQILDQAKRIVVQCKGIHDEKSLTEFMVKQQSVKEAPDFVQWRVFLFEDYSATESVFVFKCAHQIADVTAQMLMLFNMQDDPKMTNMPTVTSTISTCWFVLSCLMLPLNLLWCSFLTVVCLPKEFNGFKTPEIAKQLTSEKNASISLDISQNVLMEKARQNGGTLNDLIMSILSISLKQYLQLHVGDNQTDRIQLAIPLTLRKKPKFLLDFAVDNQFSVLPFRLRLFDSFKEAFQEIHGDLNQISYSLTPFAAVHMHRVIMHFPSILRYLTLNDFSKRVTFTYVFVHGPQRPITIASSKSHTQAFLAVSMGTMPGSFSVFCHNKTIKIGMVTDKAALKHPQKLMDIVYQNLDEVCGPSWRLQK